MNDKTQEGNTKIAVGFAGKDEIELYLQEVAHKDKALDNYLIAYIDFLGTKEKMQQKSSFESLQILNFILSGAKKKAAFITDINLIDNFDIKVFSDNVVIAQRVDKEKVSDQIVSLVNLVSLIQFEALFQFDFPLRGGITIGELYIDNSIVWGKGLITAYNMENSLANYPRVIISREVLELFEKCDNKTINLYPLIKEDLDGAWFVDFLLAAPNLKLIPEISASLHDKALSHEKADIRVRQKYNWIISYFNSACRKYLDRGDYEKYVVPYI